MALLLTSLFLPLTLPQPSTTISSSSYTNRVFFDPPSHTAVQLPALKSSRCYSSMINHSFRRKNHSHIVRMAPDEEKMTRRSPLDFPIEWERPKPGRRPDIFPQFSPMKTPLPPPLPADPPEEDEDEEEEKKEEEEEDPEKEDPDKPDNPDK